ncbi:MAG TPA: adenylate/guanylate cyclase domain-containing protein [Acidimicrobiales bacterium]|nr:adenylate/guanylate cyclase domain-containing protein [Acidimicrobiales bacterium]
MGLQVEADRARGPVGGTTELRHVSVLFCDLVGFTALAEPEDPEEVRELLSGYFDVARGVVGRYGGVIEKFIGDAVVALWGAPVATEDDAERAVRAALEIVSAVAEYGNQRGTRLGARVGVVTGGAATTETPEEGMVVGDRVNTAARIQSAAPPGCCYVDEATRHATAAAITYQDAGVHALKGKAEPVHLYQALRVVAGVGGALKSTGLEAPFVGRDRELRLVKDLFHASAADQRSHLVSVTGIAGVGKSRLAWEFYKYLDGLSDTFRWHRGRCLSYGDGVTYWALADMVRSRAGILEAEDPVSGAAKLHACVEEHISDPDERRWVEPRLAHLLGIEERSARDKEDLFAAWRLFFERMSEVRPVVMSFEDVQWADSSLLDFVEYLLDWSRNHAIFVLTLSRPELVERRPSWGAGRRNFTSIYLEPLSKPAMRDLLTGLVPGLPDDVTDRILARAEGVPLYAVETVRMLIDRGQVVPDGDGYRPAGPIGALDIPGTLHALIAARLDGLTQAERGLLQNAAVIGKTFSKETVGGLCGLPSGAVEELLSSLVRKEVVGLQADARSADRGQYSFLQDLIRAVAYETLPKRDRKEKHLALAQLLAGTWAGDDDEIVEVVASHYLDAYRLAPSAPDSAEVKARARETLARAGERAAALAAAETAHGYFKQALELADDAPTRSALEERAGQAAVAANRMEEARAHYEAAISSLEGIGEVHAGARVSARLGEIDYVEGRLEQGIERMEKAFSRLADEAPDSDLAMLAAQLGRLHLFSGAHDLAAARLEFALTLAERFRLPEPLSQALNTKAVLLEFHGRHEEAMVLVQHSLKVALDHDLRLAALRAYGNLCAFLTQADRLPEARAVVAEATELARRVGDRPHERWFLAGELYLKMRAGEWDEALAVVDEMWGMPDLSPTFIAHLMAVAVEIHVRRGELEAARALLESTSDMENSEELQYRSGYAWAKTLVLREEHDYDGALAAAGRAVQARHELGVRSIGFGLVEQIETAMLVDRDMAEELVTDLEKLAPGETTPFLMAQAARFRAKLSPNEAERGFSSAAAGFRELSLPFWLAVVSFEFSQWLGAQGRTAEARPLLAEARQLFEKLRARPWVDRLDGTASVEEVPA